MKPSIKPVADIRYRDHAGPDSTRNEVAMFLDFRVFIMGVEVTDYVKDSISWTRSLGASENTCQFSLDNSNDRFVMTAENFRKFRSTEKDKRGDLVPTETGGPYQAETRYNFNQSNNPEHLPYTGLNIESTTDIDLSKMTWFGSAGESVDETAKRQLFEYKVRHVLDFTQGSAHNPVSLFADSSGVVEEAAYTSTEQLVDRIPKYNLNVKSLVIHLHDEIRVFMADPNHDPVATGFNRWVPVFSGFVTSAQVSESLTDGTSSISVSCADIRYMLRKMRVSGNIQAVNQVQTYIRFDDAVGLFQDSAFMADATSGDVKFTNLAAMLSFRQLTRGLLCGDNVADIAALDATNLQNNGVSRNILSAKDKNIWEDKIMTRDTLHMPYSGVRVSGVGNLSIGYEFATKTWRTATWSERVENMELWQDLLIFGAKLDWYTDEEVDRIGGGTKPVLFIQAQNGQDIDGLSPYSVMNGFVHYMFPSEKEEEGGNLGIRNMIERGIINPTSDVEWSNRLDVLAQAAEAIDYKIQVNGMGDVCFEYPMYDFTPNVFGKYAETMALSDGVKSQEINDEGDGNVVTCLQIVGGFSAIDESNPDAKNNTTVKDQAYSVFIKSDVMAARYGIVVEEHKIPWALDVWALTKQDAAGNVVNNDAIHKNTLASFGVIEFFKRIAAMSSMSMEMSFNPYLLPNRPLLNKHARRLALTESISVSLNIDGIPSTSAETKWIKKASQRDMDAQRGNAYQTLTGYPNTPFGYAADGLKLFTSTQLDRIRTIYGIEIIDPTTNKLDDATKSALANGGSFNGEASSGVYGGGYGSDFIPGTGQAYSISDHVLASYKRFDRLLRQDPETYGAVVEVASYLGSPARDVYRMMEHESGGRDHIDPLGHNSMGARGVIQFIPSTLRSLGEDPETFFTKYPTVQSQVPLVKKYFSFYRKLFPLNTPYRLIICTANPGSLKVGDDMFADFAESLSPRIRQLAPSIKKWNPGINKPADFCLVKGYNYYDPQGGKKQVGKFVINFHPLEQPDTPPVVSESAASKPGMRIGPSALSM